MNKRVAIRLQAAFLSVSHTLILFVREGHGRGDRNAIARVDPQQIFDGTDNDDVVCEVPHDHQFVLFPPDQRFFDQSLG